MAYVLSNGHVTDDVTHVTLKGQTRDPNTLERNISKTTLARDFKFGMQPFYRECRAGAQIIFPESGRGLGYVTPTIFGIRSNISLKLLELETSNLIHGFVWAMPSSRTNNLPESRRGLGHVNHTIFGSTIGSPSDSLASCFLRNLEFLTVKQMKGRTKKTQPCQNELFLFCCRIDGFTMVLLSMRTLCTGRLHQTGSTNAISLAVSIKPRSVALTNT